MWEIYTLECYFFDNSLCHTIITQQGRYIYYLIF